ncbi:MAG: hypothetical protein IIZ18_01525, partial [Ruminococcus sp.]|nr:hypothetical protein [Ruminococcus sp.]
ALFSCNPSVEVARLPLAGSFVRRPHFYGSRQLSCMAENVSRKVNAVALNYLGGRVDFCV